MVGMCTTFCDSAAMDALTFCHWKICPQTIETDGLDEKELQERKRMARRISGQSPSISDRPVDGARPRILVRFTSHLRGLLPQEGHGLGRLLEIVVSRCSVERPPFQVYSP